LPLRWGYFRVPPPAALPEMQPAIYKATVFGLRGEGVVKAARQAVRTGAGRKKAAERGKHRPRGTGASFVYDSLKTKILNLELKPGRLLDETELSRTFNVSRSPVREALIRLAAEGLVDAPKNRPSTVAQFDFSTLPAYFDAMQLLYRLSTRLAAARPSPTAIANLREIERQLEEAHLRVDVLGIVRLNREFHASIAEMGGNTFVTAWMRSLLDQGQRIFRLYINHYGDRVPLPKLSQHHAIIAAIEHGDVQAAEIAGKADADTLIDDVLKILAHLPSALFTFEPQER
jgi:DNA-binding GntR family transcriptional regulator